MYSTVWMLSPVQRPCAASSVLVVAPPNACDHQSASFESLLYQTPTTVAALFMGGVSGAPALRGEQLLLELTQSVCATVETPLLLVVTCASAGAAITTAQAIVPTDDAHGGTVGFGRVLRLEHPALRQHNLRIAPNARVDMAIASCLMTPSGMQEAESVLSGQAKFASRLRRAHEVAVPKVGGSALPGCYLITGGLGGLGLRAASLLVECGAESIVLSSRSGHIAGDGQHLDEQFHLLGAAPAMIATDVGDSAEGRAVVTYRSLKGMLHAAGVL